MLEADYFEKKRRELGMERADELATVQRVLEEWYPGQARAKQLHRGVLRVVTPSSAVASELRMRQVELMSRLDLSEVRLAISIASI